MWNKILVTCTIIIALLIAVLAMALPAEHIKFVIVVSHFFEVMLPILIVGALLFYLIRGSSHNVWHCIIPACAVFIAIILAVLAVSLNPMKIEFVVLLSRFFEIMLPILGVGALLKYLTVCTRSCSTEDSLK